LYTNIAFIIRRGISLKALIEVKIPIFVLIHTSGNLYWLPTREEISTVVQNVAIKQNKLTSTRLSFRMYCLTQYI